MLPTLILSAGLGTRLRPLSEWRAKPLVPVGDRPAIAHILERVRAAGAPRIVVNAHHRADDLRAFLPPDVALSHEALLLGTAGGIRRAAALLGEGDVLVWNGDILAEVDLGALARAHCAEATLVVQPRGDDRGNIGIDAHGAVVRMRRETARAGEVRSADFLGIHVVGAALRARMPEVGDSIGDVYLPALRKGARIGVFEYGAPFWDIGTIASYLDANLAWLEARGARAWSAPSSIVDASVTLDRSVVGDGATVTGHGAVERCVVWPGARAVAPIADTVVTPFGAAKR